MTIFPIAFPRLLGLSIGGFPIGVSSLVNSILGGLTMWVANGASTLINSLGTVMNSTTTPTLGAGFSVEFAAVERVGALFVAPFLGAAVIGAIVRQDLGALARTVLLKLPLAFLLSGVAIQLVSLSISAVDELSAALLSAAGVSSATLFSAIAQAIVQISTGSAGLGGLASLLFAGFAALAAFFLWLELVLRSVAIVIATLFLPVALAGVVWPSTAHWARRLAETIAALVLSKLVVTAILALSITSLAKSQGASVAVEGTAMLLLAALAPFSVLRLMPMIEAGAASHLDGLSHRAMRTGHRVAATAVGVASEIGLESSSLGEKVVDGVGFFEGSPVDEERINAIASTIKLNNGGDSNTGSDLPTSKSISPFGATTDVQNDDVGSSDDD